ncbi:hypothetical protein GVN21_16770 [Caulobacter sp. SLTY]|uniref:hypothetical protein n=1 Tax=Caulobacter sp. SLTY TaxID=2683262 RepID=UPI00141342A2|nr:hypothetical protein [Caulobacter sp. SLTY]NBB17021.1 hypothetical protein [Caulobacter sp. SLTY]
MRTGSISSTAAERARLRQWLEHLAQEAIDWLDVLDAEEADREDDELGDDESEEALRA